MTTVQRVAQIFGIIFILIGLLGFFVPGGMDMNADMTTSGMLLGMFPVNLLHNVAHLLLGVWGVLASRSFGGAKSYATIAGGLYLVLAVLGFVAPTTFGLMPIGGNDIWLHLVLAVALLYFGLTSRETTTAAATP